MISLLIKEGFFFKWSKIDTVLESIGLDIYFLKVTDWFIKIAMRIQIINISDEENP